MRITLLIILTLLSSSCESDNSEKHVKHEEGPISVVQLKKEYGVWKPVVFSLQNNTEIEQICNIALEWVKNDKRIAEISDIGMNTIAKKTRVWVIKPKSNISITWDPKIIPKLYYNGEKGDVRFRIECRKGFNEEPKIMVNSDIFTIK